MIEFKADCGHTVRAKDDDAGKVVRCAYCGREAQVPQDDQDELDFLFSEVGENSSAGSTAGAKVTGNTKASRAAGMPFAGAGRNADPFALIKKMSYVAVFLICVIFVGKKAWPTIQEMISNQKSEPAVVDKPKSTPSSPSQATPKPSQKPRQGFVLEDLDRRGKEGVWIIPAPKNAVAYICSKDDLDEEYNWLQDVRNTTRVETPAPVDLRPGIHNVVVALPLNDRGLNDLRQYGYVDVRRNAENPKSKLEQRSRAIAEYFRPDSSLETRLVEITGRLHVIRRYQVTVHQTRWSVLSPLFLPRDEFLADKRDDLSTPYMILRKLVPRGEAFAFDKSDTEYELEFYGVDDSRVRDDLVEILKRLGAMSFTNERGVVRLFTVDPYDGLISGVLLD